MSGIDFNFNVGDECGTAPCQLGNYQVRVSYNTSSQEQLYKPLSLDGAEKTLCVLASRADVQAATIEPVGT